MQLAETNMTMAYELITPEIAMEYLKRNVGNRSISKSLVLTYALDMKNGRWDNRTGDAISFDEKGILKNGQHRLSAIINSGIPIKTWVCRSVSENGIYDYNRKRSLSDQVTILANELENIYHSTRYTGTARVIIGNFSQRVVSPKELVDFTRENKEVLDGYWLKINKNNTAKFGIVVIQVALFLAYLNGVDMVHISHFFDVLRSGMSIDEADFPILAYRNYILARNTRDTKATIEEVSKCQHALKSYLKRNKSKRVKGYTTLLYPITGLKGENNDTI